MSNDVRTDIGSDYPFRIEASDAKRVRVLNLGPDSIFYDVGEEVSVDVSSELEVGDGTDFSTPLWVISSGSSRAYLYHYEWDDFVDSFEARGTESADFTFFPDDIEDGQSLEWNGTEFVAVEYADPSDLESKQDTALITDSGLGVVVHGADDDVARPVGFALVLWEGSVEPTLALDGDIWVDTS